jgi:enoyl-CoA hydratase/carnithine racemase
LNIVLNRPSKSNGLSLGMYINITNAINNAQKDEKVKIIVLSGKGKNFCSGNDL